MLLREVEGEFEVIRAEAERSGDEILYLWAFDLEDGTFNVKAIVKPKEGGVTTVGARVG